jgi:hypothetical protein
MDGNGARTEEINADGAGAVLLTRGQGHNYILESAIIQQRLLQQRGQQ